MASFVETTLSKVARKDQMEAIIKNKLRGKKLLLENSHTVTMAEAKRRIHTVRSQQSGNQQRISSVPRARRRKMLLVATQSVSYEQFLDQHARWCQHAATILQGTGDKEGLTQLVQQLDWHGAKILRIVHTPSASHMHATGLVLAETRRMLLLLGPTKRVWLPKVGTVLEIELPRSLSLGMTVHCDASLHAA